MLACKASQQGETVVAQNMKYLKYFPCFGGLEGGSFELISS